MFQLAGLRDCTNARSGFCSVDQPLYRNPRKTFALQAAQAQAAQAPTPAHSSELCSTPIANRCLARRAKGLTPEIQLKVNFHDFHVTASTFRPSLRLRVLPSTSHPRSLCRKRRAHPRRGLLPCRSGATGPRVAGVATGDWRGIFKGRLGDASQPLQLVRPARVRLARRTDCHLSCMQTAPPAQLKPARLAEP